MDLGELKRRLTSHLGGEESLDLHTAQDREAAIKEGYLHVSNSYQLTTGTLPSFGPLPADFLSYGIEVGTYNKLPPPLTSDASQPWGGLYSQLHPSLSFYAAWRLYSDKGPEMYERAMYWKGVFDEEMKKADQMLVRNASADLAVSNADDSTLNGIRASIRFNLNTSEVSPELARRAFPPKVIDAAIVRAYREITSELDLSIRVASLPLSPNPSGVSEQVPLPVDFIAPYPDAAFTIHGRSVIGGAFPYGAQSSFAPSFSIGRDGSAQFVTVQNFAASDASLLVRYVAEPSPLVNQNDKPWGGSYPTVNKLIILRVMRDLMRGRPETYNFSRFWQNEFEREVIPVKRMLKRYNLGQANRVFMGHMNDSAADAFIPLYGGEGNKGTENG